MAGEANDDPFPARPAAVTNGCSEPLDFVVVVLAEVVEVVVGAVLAVDVGVEAAEDPLPMVEADEVPPRTTRDSTARTLASTTTRHAPAWCTGLERFCDRAGD